MCDEATRAEITAVGNMASAECAPLFARWMSGAADPESDEAALCACVAALDSHQAFLKMRCLIPPLEDTVMRLVGACPSGAPFRKPPFCGFGAR